MSIKFKIIAIFILSAFIPFLVIGSLVYLDFRNTLEKSLLNNRILEARRYTDAAQILEQHIPSNLSYVYLLKKGETIPLKEGVSKLDLDFIIDYFKLEKRKGAHNALQDALLTREAFEKIVKS